MGRILLSLRESSSVALKPYISGIPFRTRLCHLKVLVFHERIFPTFKEIRGKPIFCDFSYLSIPPSTLVNVNKTRLYSQLGTFLFLRQMHRIAECDVRVRRNFWNLSSSNCREPSRRAHTCTNFSKRNPFESSFTF